MILIPRAIYRKIHKVMPIPCVDVVVWSGGHVLLVKRTIEPLKGEWFVPGGRIMRDETIDFAVSRVVRSETGLDVFKEVFVGFDETFFKVDPFRHGGGTHTVNLVFSASKRGGVIRLDSGHSSHKWVKPFEVLREGAYDVGAYDRYLVRRVLMALASGWRSHDESTA